MKNREDNLDHINEEYKDTYEFKTHVENSYS